MAAVRILDSRASLLSAATLEAILDSKTIEALANVLMRLHGGEAEKVARQRALRCTRMLEKDWAITWVAVANYIADQLI